MFTKSDLKTGMVVETIDGGKWVVSVGGIFEDTLLHENKTNHNRLGLYNYDFTYNGVNPDHYEIVKVWTIELNKVEGSTYLLRPSEFSKLIEMSTRLIWEKVVRYKVGDVMEITGDQAGYKVGQIVVIAHVGANSASPSYRVEYYGEGYSGTKATSFGQSHSAMKPSNYVKPCKIELSISEIEEKLGYAIKIVK